MQVLLETERLVLRRFTRADADHLFELDSDPEVMRYLSGGVPTPRSVIESDILPRFCVYDEECLELGYWAAIERASGDFLGWFSLRPAAGSPPGAVALGYRLRRAAWGQGYATEGVCALIRLAFTRLGATRMVASTYEDNLASRRVLEKAGLSFVRAYRVSADDLAATGTFDASTAVVFDGDDIEYALDLAEWERRQQLSGQSRRQASIVCSWYRL